MKKKEFLNALRKKLDILESSEVEDIITEYSGYIDEKMESGVSEENAVEAFGNLDELANDLLSAYKIKIKKEKDPIGDFSKKVLENINYIVDELSEKSSKEIIQFIIEIVILIFMIGLCRLPVSILISLGKEIFFILSSPLNRIFFSIWKFVLEFAYFVLSILVFIRIVDKRYLKNRTVKMNEKKIQTEKITKVKKNKSKEEVSEPQSKTFFIGEMIIKIGVFFLKFMAICILFGASFYLISMAAILGICIYLLIQGVTYFGFYLIMLALFVLGIVFFHLLYNFVIDRKNKGVSLFIQIMISILLLGGGCGLAVFEVADTEFINGVPNDLKTEKLVEELAMDKDTIFIGNVANYIVDNDLNIVKVEFEYYPLGTKMSTNIKKKEDKVFLYWSFDRIHIRSELLEHVVNDLKQKKVYNYHLEPTITIIANEKNIEQIKMNRQKYYKTYKNYSSCEFVKTYHVEMLKPSLDQNEVIVVVSQYNEDNVVSVKLSKDLANILEVGNDYEFTFKTYQAFVDTDIENVFYENDVIEIQKTNKKGFEQRQDETCTLFY